MDNPARAAILHGMDHDSDLLIVGGGLNGLSAAFALRRRGIEGVLVIDQAEALTAIDVNTGRFVGRKSLQDTIFQTNLEAVQEVVHQLRLRNIGGLIIIDFIDMESPEHRERVCAALVNALRSDRAKTNVLKISELGLVEMTRKRVRESLGRTLTEPCFYCEGRGVLKSKTTICYEILLISDCGRSCRPSQGCGGAGAQDTGGSQAAGGAAAAV